MDNFKQSVLVTGTSAGSIGAALAASFANEGLTVFATVRDRSKIEPSLAARPNVHILLLDVTSTASIAAAVEAVSARTHGSLDYLVNNAGAGYTTPLADVDLDKARQLFEVNFWGVMAMTRAFLPLLVKAKGTVVNISSVGAVVHTPWIGVYSASKAALTTASETLRLELKPLGVGVVTAMVGSVKSNFHAHNPSFHLPADSLYKPIEQHIADTNAGKHSPPGTDAAVFADQFVKNVLKGRTGQLWMGKMADMTRWVSKWVPWGMLDSMVASGRGIDELRKAGNGGAEDPLRAGGGK